MKNSAVDIPNELDGFGLFNIDSAKELCLNSILLDNFESTKWLPVLKRIM